MSKSQGKLIIFSAPSGSGKTTLVRHLLDKMPVLSFSISAASRAPRGEEKHEKDYYFLNNNEFDQAVKNNEFLEWEEVYKGHKYGTLRKEVERIWAAGKHVIFDIDVVGGLNLKKQFGERALAVFVKAPSILALEERLRYRKTDSEEKIKQRIEKAHQEMAKADGFDKIIVNADLEKAKLKAEEIVSNFLK